MRNAARWVLRLLQRLSSQALKLLSTICSNERQIRPPLPLSQNFEQMSQTSPTKSPSSLDNPMYGATSSKVAYQDSSNESVSSSGRNSSAASAKGGNVTLSGYAWIPWSILMLFAFWEITRVESRAVRAETQAQQAIAELSQAKREYAAELQLRRYNLDWFRTHEFAELEVKTGILDARLNSCRRNLDGWRIYHHHQQ
jgi:hypothetical protein